MAIGVSDFDIDMPAFDAGGTGSSGAFDYNYDQAYDDNYNQDQSQFDQYNPDNYDMGNNFEWTGYDPWEDAADSFWATDNETFGNENTQEDGDGGFWGSVWDFATSDGMVDFLKGAAGVGYDLWRSNLNNAGSSRRSSGGGGGGSPSYVTDPDDVKGKALTFTRR